MSPPLSFIPPPSFIPVLAAPRLMMVFQEGDLTSDGWTNGCRRLGHEVVYRSTGLVRTQTPTRSPLPRRMTMKKTMTTTRTRGG
jgi:hypothetical protein